MADALDIHISEDILEAYSLGLVSEAELAPLEEHLLVCSHCQDRLQATDLFIATLRHVLREPGMSQGVSQGNGSCDQA